MKVRSRKWNIKAAQPSKFYFDNLWENKLNCKIKFWFMAFDLLSLILRNPNVVKLTLVCK